MYLVEMMAQLAYLKADIRGRPLLARQATPTTLAEAPAQGLAVVGSMSDGLASLSRIAYAASTRAGIG